MTGVDERSRSDEDQNLRAQVDDVCRGRWLSGTSRDCCSSHGIRFSVHGGGFAFDRGSDERGRRTHQAAEGLLLQVDLLALLISERVGTLPRGWRGREEHRYCDGL